MKRKFIVAFSATLLLIGVAIASLLIVADLGSAVSDIWTYPRPQWLYCRLKSNDNQQITSHHNPLDCRRTFDCLGY